MHIQLTIHIQVCVVVVVLLLQFPCVLLQAGVFEGIQCHHLRHHLPEQYSTDTGDTHHHLTGRGLTSVSATGAYRVTGKFGGD